MKLQPTQNYVLIKLHETSRDSDILLPEGTQFKPYGEVVAVGPDCSYSKEDGIKAIQPGMKVLCLPSALLGYDEAEQLYFLAEPSILAIYED